MRRYGWIRDTPDHNDFAFVPRAHLMGVPLPPALDFVKKCPPVYDQLNLGSCTANGTVCGVDMARSRQGKAFMTPSRLFTYYVTRSMEGTIASDAGAQIRDAIKSVAKFGTVPETEWPYVIDKFAFRPKQSIFKDALREQAIKYSRIDHTNPMAIKQALAAEIPVVFGCAVYSSFEADSVAKTGLVPMPQRGEDMLGGHCMAIVGYDDPRGRYTVRNSWGEEWGDGGYCYMPYDYVHGRLASDFWVIETVE